MGIGTPEPDPGEAIAVRLNKTLAYLLLVVLPVVSVIIGSLIGRVMGVEGWWAVGLVVLEAAIGFLTGVKLLYLI